VSYQLQKALSSAEEITKCMNLDNDKVIALPRVGGLHHKYVWKKAA
jgi:hypothetical protein